MADTQDRVPAVYIENGDVVNLDSNDPIEVNFSMKKERKNYGLPTGLKNPEQTTMKWHHGHNGSIINGVPRIGFMKGGEKARWSDIDMADPVQGNDAADLIVSAIEGFNNLDSNSNIPTPDIIILARGGGSIEDLWCFNNEELAREIAAFPIPSISGVGHEIDFTICDFVADMRAPTPTASGELVTEFTYQVKDKLKELNVSINSCINIAKERVVNVQKLFPSYEYLFSTKTNDLNSLAHRLPGALKLYIQKEMTNYKNIGSKLSLNTLKEKIKNSQSNLLISTKQLVKVNKNNFNNLSNRLNSTNKLLESLSYKSVIKRGFSVARNSSNKIISEKTDIIEDNRINIETKFGIIQTEVKK